MVYTHTVSIDWRTVTALDWVFLFVLSYIGMIVQALEIGSPYLVQMMMALMHPGGAVTLCAKTQRSLFRAAMWVGVGYDLYVHVWL